MFSLLVRCDGSAALGMGHMMRCRTLAQSLRAHGVTTRFLLGESSPAAEELIRSEGFLTERIPAPACRGQYEALPPAEAGNLLRAASRHRAAGVLVDHYGYTAAHLRLLADAGLKVAVIDDMGNRDLSPACWLLNQNHGAEGIPYRLAPPAVKLLGPRFALLRPAFLEKRRGLRRAFFSGDAKLLLTLGGGDTAALAEAIIAALSDAPAAALPQTLEIRCVLGGHAQVSERFRQVMFKSRHRVSLWRNVADMETLMAWADLSINGGGSTCWELCCLGVPMLIVTTSEDQAGIAAALAQAGCARSLGWWNPADSPLRLAAAISELLGGPAQRQPMSQRGMALVDGLGARRAAASLVETFGKP